MTTTKKPSDTIVGKSPEGHPITESDIERWADEAEAGFEPEQLRKASQMGRPTLDAKGQRATKRIEARVTDAEYARIEQQLDKEGIRISELTRKALSEYLAAH